MYPGATGCNTISQIARMLNPPRPTLLLPQGMYHRATGCNTISQIARMLHPPVTYHLPYIQSLGL